MPEYFLFWTDLSSWCHRASMGKDTCYAWIFLSQTNESTDRRREAELRYFGHFVPHGQVSNHGHVSSPPGFPPRGAAQQRNSRMQVQSPGAFPGPSQRRDRVVPNKHHGGKFGQYTDGTWVPNDRVPSSKAGEFTRLVISHWYHAHVFFSSYFLSQKWMSELLQSRSFEITHEQCRPNQHLADLCTPPACCPNL